MGQSKFLVEAPFGHGCRLIVPITLIETETRAKLIAQLPFTRKHPPDITHIEAVALAFTQVSQALYSFDQKKPVSAGHLRTAVRDLISNPPPIGSVGQIGLIIKEPLSMLHMHTEIGKSFARIVTLDKF